MELPIIDNLFLLGQIPNMNLILKTLAAPTLSATPELMR